MNISIISVVPGNTNPGQTWYAHECNETMARCLDAKLKLRIAGLIQHEKPIGYAMVA